MSLFSYAYADSDTGSAISIEEHLKLMAAAGIVPIEQAAIDAAGDRAAAANTMVQIAAGPGTSNSYPLYITNVTNVPWARYEYMDDGTIDFTYINVSSFGQFAQELTYSIAASTQALYERMWEASWDEGGQTLHQGLSYLWLNLDNIETNLNSYLPTMESYLSNLPTISSRVNTTNTRLNTINTTLGTTNTTLSNIYSGLVNPNSSSGWSTYLTNNPIFNLKRYRQVSNGGTTADIDRTITDWNPINQIWFWLYSLNDSSVLAFRDLTSGIFASPANPPQWLDKDLNATVLPRTSLWYDIRTLGVNLNNIVARLGYVLASDEDIEARTAAQAQQSAAVDDFIDSSGSASVSLSDLGDIADMSSGLKDYFDVDVSPGLVFDSIGGNNGSVWHWFSAETRQSLSVNQGVYSYKGSQDSSSTPMLDAYYSDLEKILTGGFKP